MADNPSETIDVLLKQITAAVDRTEWAEARRLSELALSLDSENTTAAESLAVANRAMAGERTCESGMSSAEAGGEGDSDRLVGRGREIARLSTYLAESIAGRGRLVMLAGEPGVGKTRMAEELRTYAQIQGAEVLWGRCHEDQGAPPYWPWIQAIRTHVQYIDAAAMSDSMGSGAGVIAEVIPGVREKLPGVPRPMATSEPESARFRLFDALATFLKAASALTPILIVLDDLHWADGPSLRFLEYIAHELTDTRLLIVGTYRSLKLSWTNSLQSTLGELTRERLFERVPLRGLTRAEVRSFIEQASLVSLPEELVDAIFTQTEGNPLFVSEVVKLLIQQDMLSPESLGKQREWNLSIPDGVRQAISRRLDHLSVRCHELLAIGAVSGRVFTSELLAGVTDSLTVAPTDEALEEALSAGVIEEYDDTTGNYQFTHALVQQAIFEDLTRSRRVGLHLKIAETLEQVYGDSVDEHSAELARHYGAASSSADKRKVAHYALLAAEEALSRLAYSEALVHCEVGLNARGQDPIDEQIALVLSARGAARRRLDLGDWERREAFNDFERAFTFFSVSGDIDRAIVVAEAADSTGPDGSQLYKRMIPLVQPDSIEAARLTRFDAVGFMKGVGETFNYRDAKAKCNAALEIAWREQDLLLEMQISASMSVIESIAARHQKALEYALRATELAQIIVDPLMEVVALGVILEALIVLGERARAGNVKNAYLKTTARYQLHRCLALWLAFDLAHQEGDWEEAREYAEMELAAPAGGGEKYFSPCVLGRCLRVETELGNPDRADVQLRKIIALNARVDAEGRASMLTYGALLAALEIPLAARTTGDLTHLNMAESAAHSILADFKKFIWAVRMAKERLGLIAVLRNDRQAAANWYDELTSPHHVCDRTDSFRIVALLASATGNIDAAIERLDERILFLEKAEYLPELAWSCCDCADILLDRSGTDDIARAKALFRKGLEIAKRKSMKPLAERIKERMGKTGGYAGSAAGPSNPCSLTQREVEVLTYVVRGFTNNDIGDSLEISHRTVARHLQNIYEKIGCANRAEAGAHAIKHGLTEP
jgi:predicted ATPase/DNA-binding CsgD family transcriptional regulator